MSQKRRKLVGITAAVAAFAVVGGVAAQFTTSTQSAPQNIGTGTLALALDDVAPTAWTQPIENLAAGDSVERFVDLRNAGSLKIAGIAATQTNTLGALLTSPSDISVKLQACAVAWNVTNGTCTSGAVDVLGSSSVRAWAADSKALSTFEDFGAGDVRHLKVTTTLASTATNVVQAMSGTITYTFSAVQRTGGTWGVVSDATTTLAAPTGIATTINGTSATVSFTDPTKGAARYSLTYTNAAGNAVTVVLPAGTTSYTISGLTPGSYSLSLDGKMGLQSSKATSTMSISLPAPSALTVSATTTSASVNWANNAGAGATYVVTATAADGTSKTVTTAAGATSATVTGLKADTGYTITVKAQSGGVESSTVSATTKTQAEQNLNIKAADYLVSSSSTSTAPSMLKSAQSAAIGKSPNGDIFVVGGGASGGGAQKVVQKFTPSTGTWTQLADAPNIMMQAATGTDQNGLMYIMGGYGVGSSPMKTAWTYNTVSGAWVALPNMPVLAYGTTGGLSSNGSFYVTGGTQAKTSTATLADDYYSASTYKYDTVAKTWTKINSMTNGRRSQTGVMVGDKLYVIGGSAAGNASVTSTEILDTKTDTWSTGPALPTTATTNGGAFADSSGSVYYMGGSVTYRLAPGATSWQAMSGGIGVSYGAIAYDGNDTVYAMGVLGSNSVGKYSISAQSDSKLAVLPTTRSDSATGASSADGKIYVAGGVGASGSVLNTVEVYDTNANTWTTLPGMPTARKYASSSVGADGKFYVFGGQNAAGTVLNTTEVYDPASNSWSTKAPLLTANYGSGSAAANGKIFVFGGWTSTTTSTAATQIYDPATDTWTTGVVGNADRFVQARMGYDGKIYVHSSFREKSGIYDPVAGTWATWSGTAYYPSQSQVGIAPDGTFVRWGGKKTDGTVNTVSAFWSYSTKQWTSGNGGYTMSPGLYGAVSASDKWGRTYMIGGAVSGGASSNAVVRIG